MDEYIISDLIMENSNISISKFADGSYSEECRRQCRICRIDTSTQANKKTSESSDGNFITVYTPLLCYLDDHQVQEISTDIATELRRIISASIGSPIDKRKTFLIIGLGNSAITPDCIGPMTVGKLNVTRHVKLTSPLTFDSMDICSVCAISCGVLGQTGVESAELVKALTAKIQPDAVIVIDALAARAWERLGATVQISDAGISPGAGVYNKQTALTKSSLGVPVIAIGVPTVVSAATLVGDALTNAGITKKGAILKKLTDSGKNLFVAPKECDLIAESVSDVLSASIEKALGVI